MIPVDVAVGDRVRHVRQDRCGAIAEIPLGRGYVFVQWDDVRPGNLAGEWPNDLDAEQRPASVASSRTLSCEGPLTNNHGNE